MEKFQKINLNDDQPVEVELELNRDYGVPIPQRIKLEIILKNSDHTENKMVSLSCFFLVVTCIHMLARGK